MDVDVSDDDEMNEQNQPTYPEMDYENYQESSDETGDEYVPSSDSETEDEYEEPKVEVISNISEKQYKI
jgi:hypothetical protein